MRLDQISKYLTNSRTGAPERYNKGITFWDGGEDETSAKNPIRTFDAMVYELLGAEEFWSDQYELKGIKITVEIEESRKQ